MQSHTARNLTETADIAKGFLDSLVSSEKATVIGLYGNLGAGKTSFTQALARSLGVQDTVTSPTFVIEKIYKLQKSNFEHLIHIDAYRIEKSNELLNLGWQEIIENPKNLIVIEWPEKVADILPKNIKKITFEFIDESTRKIDIE